jgi:hypothetical protein
LILGLIDESITIIIYAITLVGSVARFFKLYTRYSADDTALLTCITRAQIASIAFAS